MKLILIMLLIGTSNYLYSQKIDTRYIRAYHYIDSLEKGKFNVSAVIRYVDIASFSNQEQVKNGHLVSPDLLDSRSFYNNHFFQAYINADFRQYFKTKEGVDRYLVFSQPVSNILLAVMLKGMYNSENLDNPYFGTGYEYLIIFDAENNIVKCLKEGKMYN